MQETSSINTPANITVLEIISVVSIAILSNPCLLDEKAAKLIAQKTV
ncbi:MAG: hypothetical protein ABW104_10315 [Candidatus Thiodiazotropha sp. 6PLUC2]